MINVVVVGQFTVGGMNTEQMVLGYIKKQAEERKKMALRLRTLGALPKDLSLIPTLMVAHNCL